MQSQKLSKHIIAAVIIALAVSMVTATVANEQAFAKKTQASIKAKIAKLQAKLAKAKKQGATETYGALKAQIKALKAQLKALQKAQAAETDDTGTGGAATGDSDNSVNQGISQDVTNSQTSSCDTHGGSSTNSTGGNGGAISPGSCSNTFDNHPINNGSNTN